MGERTGTNASSARRARRRLDKAGLIEVRGYGEDGNSCLVRPILRDGTPVFPDPEATIPPVNLTAPPPVNLTADLLKEETLRTDSPPLPPIEPEPAQPRGEASPAAEPQPPEPAKVAELVATTFLAFWLAIGQTGPEGYARAQWGKLTAADKAAIRERLTRPRSWAADMWAGKWLECRVWEEAVAAPTRPEQVHLREGTAEWRAWQRHLIATRGRGSPTDSRGGWYFPSKLPPLPCQGGA
jgi:hypothetical protein